MKLFYVSITIGLFVGYQSVFCNQNETVTSSEVFIKDLNEEESFQLLNEALRLRIEQESLAARAVTQAWDEVNDFLSAQAPPGVDYFKNLKNFDPFNRKAVRGEKVSENTLQFFTKLLEQKNLQADPKVLFYEKHLKDKHDSHLSISSLLDPQLDVDFGKKELQKWIAPFELNQTLNASLDTLKQHSELLKIFTKIQPYSSTFHSVFHILEEKNADLKSKTLSWSQLFHQAGTDRLKNEKWKQTLSLSHFPALLKEEALMQATYLWMQYENLQQEERIGSLIAAIGLQQANIEADLEFIFSEGQLSP